MRSDLRCLLALLFLSVASPLCAADAVSGGGPLNLLITYRSQPADRPAFRAYLQSEYRSQLDKLRQQGVLKSYQILFNPFVSSGTWDSMTVLGFAHYSDTQRWKEIERTMPGGLTAKGLRLAKPVDTYSADLSWSGTAETPSDDRASVYYVIPYEYVALDPYRKYVDAYVIPQVQGWMRKGALASYRFFMHRFPVGPTWDALFIYQYRDLEAFGRRDEIIAEVRRTLVDDPVWKQFHDTKQSIRTETENTTTESLAASQ
jgi:hypothetical protein